MTCRAAPMGLLLLLPLFLGCGGEASPLAWSIRFENSTDREATAVVATSVLEGGCDGTSVYTSNINLRAGSSARQPDELGPGLHGFRVEARGLDCTIISSVCDEYELPVAQMEIVSTLTGAGGGGGGCAPGTECDGAGSCIPVIMPDSSMPLPCDTEDAACDDGEGGPTGICHMGACCLGCWDGTDCQTGATPAACGQMGGACEPCDPGDSCQGAVCITTSTSPGFSMAPKSNFYRHSDGRYWGNGDTADFDQVGPVAGAEDTLKGYTGDLRFADIAAAEVATAGIEALTGDLYTWGTNAAGALGGGSTDFGAQAMEPTQVSTVNTFREVSAGGSYFCAIHTDGTLWCWGTNSNGQLGTGDTTFRAAPTRVGNRSWISVSILFEHTCAIRDDRTLWCWGKGEGGRLGDGMEIDRNIPTRVGDTADWAQVSAGVGHTCGIRVMGGERRLYCWGRASSGVLGIGDTGMTPSFPLPELVVLAGWQQVAAGDFHTCGLLDDGAGVEAYCWGFPGFGALGLGSTSIAANEPAPVALMPSNTNWESITCGHRQTCGIADGTPYCWGDSRGDDMDPTVEGWLGVGMRGPMATPATPTEVVFDPVLP